MCPVLVLGSQSQEGQEPRSPESICEVSRGHHLSSVSKFSDFFEKSLFNFRCRETAAVAAYIIAADAVKELTVGERSQGMERLRFRW